MKKDPVTGDELTRKEYVTRQIQTIVRTPWFILTFNALSLTAYLIGQINFWNFIMSWLAIIVEWLVGTYMFGQTGRDAIVMRAIRREITEKVERMEEAHGRQLEEIRQLLSKEENNERS